MRTAKLSARGSVVTEQPLRRHSKETDALQAMHDVSRLRLLAPQEFAARWKIVEKVAHLDVCSCRRANFPNGLDPASADHHFGPGI